MAVTINFPQIAFEINPLTPPVIGAGGWVTGSDVAADGTKIVRLDSGGPVFRKPGDTEWTRLKRAGVSVLAANVENDNATYDVAICYTDPNYMYVVMGNGRVWRSIDKGVNVTRTTLAAQSGSAANNGKRMVGKPLAVDPANGLVVFFGTPAAGVKFSVDGGDAWASIPTGTIPATTGEYRYIIAFDRSSTVTGSGATARTQRIYIFVPGYGIYRSTDGGATWALMTGTAAFSPAHMRISHTNGYIHLAGTMEGEADGTYRRWDGTTWTTPNANNTKALALSTINAGRVWACSVGGYLQVSNDDGATWSSSFSPARAVGDVAWLASTNEAYMSNGSIEFDPATGALWMFEGIGAWKIDSPPSSITGNQTWTAASRGIENMSMSTLTTGGPAGAVGASTQDRSAFVITRADAGVKFPVANAQNGTTSINMGNGVDWALDDEAFWVATTFPQDNTPLANRKSCYTSNNGGAWLEMTGSTAAASTAIAKGINSGAADHVGGGNIIALSKTVFIQCETNNGYLMRTTDAGASWTRCTIGTNLGVGGHNAYYLSRTVLVKDVNTPGKAWYYHTGDANDNSANRTNDRGLYVTTDYGATWTRVFNNYINGIGQDAFNGKLKQRGPNQLIWCCGDGALELWCSNDGGVTWAANRASDNVTTGTAFGQVFSFAVGAPIIAGAPNAVLVAGCRENIQSFNTDYTAYGLWLSIDGMVTWKLVTRFPGGYYSIPPADLAGDIGVFGRFYMALRGEGMVRIDVTKA